MDVDKPLVGASAEQQRQRALRDIEPSVHQHIKDTQQFSDVLLAPGLFQQFLERPAAVAHQVFSSGFEAAPQLVERFRLAERLAAGEGHAAAQRIFHAHFIERVGGGELPGGEVVGLGIMAAFAVMGAALHENHEAQPGSVYDGILYGSCYSNVH